MSTTRPRRTSTVLAPIDIADQPASKYVLVIEGIAASQAFAVDRATIENGAVWGERADPAIPRAYDLVVAVPAASPWTLIARSAMVVRTLEESMRKQKADQEGERALVKEVFGADENDTAASPTRPSYSIVPTPERGDYL